MTAVGMGRMYSRIVSLQNGRPYFRPPTLLSKLLDRQTDTQLVIRGAIYLPNTPVNPAYFALSPPLNACRYLLCDNVKNTISDGIKSEFGLNNLDSEIYN